MEAQQLDRERERLVEENRKLRLEKASLEELQRVEAIARRELGLVPPPPEQVVVVEQPESRPAGRLARAGDASPKPGGEPELERTLIPPLLAPGRRPPAPHERQARLRLMLLALSVTLWGMVMLARLRPAPGAGPRLLRAAGGAPERAHDRARPAARGARRSQPASARGLGRGRERLRRAAGDRGRRSAPRRSWRARWSSTRRAAAS